jgi:hypothetical protein
VTTHDSARAAGGRRAVGRDREEALVARLATLGTALDGEPDPRFREMTRARLVAMAAVRTPAPAPKPWFRRLVSRAEDRTVPVRRARLSAGLAGAAVAVTAVAAVVAVAAGAGPGTALYGVKRGTEQTQLALASDSTRGRTLLGFASTRLHELQDLARSGTSAAPAGTASGAPTVLAAGPSASLVLDTIATMNRQTTEGAYWVTTEAVRSQDAGQLSYLTRWAAGQTAGLQALAPELPSAAGPATQQALALLGNVSSRGTALQSALACPAGPATATGDPLGPVPASCATGSAGTAGTAGTPGTSPVPSQTGGTTTVPAPTAGPTAGNPGGLPLPSATIPGPQGGTGGLPLTTAAPPQPQLPVPTLPLNPPSGGGGQPLPSLPLPGTSPSSGGSSPSGGSILPTCVPVAPLLTC